MKFAIKCEFKGAWFIDSLIHWFIGWMFTDWRNLGVKVKESAKKENSKQSKDHVGPGAWEGVRESTRIPGKGKVGRAGKVKNEKNPFFFYIFFFLLSSFFFLLSCVESFLDRTYSFDRQKRNSLSPSMIERLKEEKEWRKKETEEEWTQKTKKQKQKQT